MLRKVDLWTVGHLTDAESKMAIVVNRGPVQSTIRFRFGQPA
jgi:hypothetical protein